MTGAPAAPVALSRSRGVLHALLDAPGRRNAVTPELLDALHAAVDTAEADPGCRVLVLSARGEHFCAGTDLTAPVPEPAAGPAAGPEAELPYWTLLDRLTRTPVVTVALVEGRATAGGVGLAAACDLVLAGPGARFRLTEALVGLVPAMALPFVARRTGEQRAFTATLLAEDLDAPAAVAAGLADLHAGEPAQALRRTLVALSRVDRSTAGALKTYRSRLFPRDARLGQDAGRVFLDRLTDPAVQPLLDRIPTPERAV
ncbi:enoyl-CoA hydratase/isomerase family protein [Streptomyces albogriseolus]|jgi:polyketide biosynthesis enoyl-CoA hydratase PksH|uniref:enoyl-CoA hydratase/isomerase family protein n=1 Tax=Streptomyces TaxID=1883 RepID=UPI000ACC76B0|nr:MULTISPECIES: enoyl-CoA hydratase/isomerase family protein [Streptomyces]GHG32470.1 enoyl-CoA hydratase [Streptomyces viridodiastaticus]